MNDDIIPEEARRFLLQNIDSIAQWEGLLLLRSQPAKPWTTRDAARELYISEHSVAELLAALAARGIVEVIEAHDGRLFQYKPKSAELDRLIGNIADLYRQYLIPVTHIIHSKPKSRVQEFANAFRLRKD